MLIILYYTNKLDTVKELRSQSSWSGLPRFNAVIENDAHWTFKWFECLFFQCGRFAADSCLTTFYVLCNKGFYVLSWQSILSASCIFLLLKFWGFSMLYLTNTVSPASLCATLKILKLIWILILSPDCLVVPFVVSTLFWGERLGWQLMKSTYDL